MEIIKALKIDLKEPTIDFEFAIFHANGWKYGFSRKSDFGYLNCKCQIITIEISEKSKKFDERQTYFAIFDKIGLYPFLRMMLNMFLPFNSPNTNQMQL